MAPDGLKVLAEFHRKRGMPRTEFAVLCLAARLGCTGPEASQAWDEADLSGRPAEVGDE